MVTWYTQVCVLLFKNTKVLLRSKSVWLLVVPFVLCGMLKAQQKISEAYTKTEDVLNTNTIQVPKIARSQESPTIEVGFTHGQKNWTQKVISHLSEYHQLELGKDIVVHPELNQTQFAQLFQKSRSSKFGILFCTDYIEAMDDTIECQIPDTNKTSLIYSIVYSPSNQISTFFYRKDEFLVDTQVVSLKLAVDNSILAYKANYSIDLSLQGFPKVPNRLYSNYNVVSNLGPVYLMIPGVLLMSYIALGITQEKELGINLFLEVNSVKPFAYWTSWVLTGWALSLVVANLTCLGGLSMQFEEFTNSPYLLMSSSLAMFNGNMVLLSCLVASLTRSTQLVYSLNLGFFLAGLTFQFLTCCSFLKVFIYLESSPEWVALLRCLFYIYPPYHLEGIFQSISEVSSSHFDSEGEIWAAGERFYWENITESLSGDFYGKHYEVPSVLFSLECLLGIAVFQIAALWYLVQTVSGNTTNTKHKLFFLSKNFWLTKTQKSLLTGDSGLEVKNLSKTYFQGIFRKPKKALKSISFSLQKGVNVVIGSNGAGKSTLLKILSKELTPSEGRVYLNGAALTASQIGFCPQECVLWKELTGLEHKYIYSVLKGATSNESLQEVDLENNIVQNYSGGMKKRLAITLAMLGNPQVVVFDEPSAGVDPLTRRALWNLIESLKSKVVVVSTHNMEEAETLADCLVVMNYGQVQLIGSLWYVKTVMALPLEILLKSTNEELLKGIKINFPETKLESLGSQTLVRVRRNFKSLVALVEYIETNTQCFSVSKPNLSSIFRMHT